MKFEEFHNTVRSLTLVKIIEKEGGWYCHPDGAYQANYFVSDNGPIVHPFTPLGLSLLDEYLECLDSKHRNAL